MKKLAEYLISKGGKLWRKENKETGVKYERVYINDVYSFGIEVITTNPKGWRGISMYYDCIAEKFVIPSVSSSRKQALLDFAAYLENQAKEN